MPLSFSTCSLILLSLISVASSSLHTWLTQRWWGLTSRVLSPLGPANSSEAQVFSVSLCGRETFLKGAFSDGRGNAVGTSVRPTQTCDHQFRLSNFGRCEWGQMGSETGKDKQTQGKWYHTFPGFLPSIVSAQVCGSSCSSYSLERLLDEVGGEKSLFHLFLVPHLFFGQHLLCQSQLFLISRLRWRA